MPQQGPWTKYQTAAESGPWAKYQQTTETPGVEAGHSTFNVPQTVPSTYGPIVVPPELRQGIRDFFGSLVQQVNPLPALDYIYRHGWTKTLQAAGGAQKAELDKAKTAYERGDYTTATAKTINWALPLLGPAIGEQQERFARGEYAKGLGGSTGIGIGLSGYKATGKAIQSKAADLLRGRAERMYQSALKPRTTLKTDVIEDRIVKTGLEESLPVSRKGLERLGNLVDDTNQKIADVIERGQDVEISPIKAAQRVNQAVPRFREQANPVADLRALGETKKEFLGQHTTPARPAQVLDTGVLDAQGNPITKVIPGRPATEIPIPAPKAQEIKTGTYAQLKSKAYGELKNAAIEGQKAIARGLKEELAGAFPELNQLNAFESKLLDLEPILQRAVNRINNQQLIGIGTPIAAGTGAVVSGSGGVGAAVGLLKAVIDDPKWKSNAAIALNHAAQRLKTSHVPVNLRMAALAAQLERAAASATPEAQQRPETGRQE